MRFVLLAIPDLVLIEPVIYQDYRGFFFESYNQKEFAEHGIPHEFVQDNYSGSKKGVLRGLHYQIDPMQQGKLVRVSLGEAVDVAVDIRPESKTFGQHIAIILSAKNRRMLYIPPGFAHGFFVLSDRMEFHYKTTHFYSPKHERGIRWNDPTLRIPWPEHLTPIISKRDAELPLFEDVFQLR